mmetsp:Transcript_14315/g.32684  ORF Transcript_14315/g.32684 Transcript_14315/m.32684 type:complete len:96 (-) Transcript_14315:29-316(-)
MQWRRCAKGKARGPRHAHARLKHETGRTTRASAAVREPSDSPLASNTRGESPRDAAGDLGEVGDTPGSGVAAMVEGKGSSLPTMEALFSRSELRK